MGDVLAVIVVIVVLVIGAALVARVTGRGRTSGGSRHQTTAGARGGGGGVGAGEEEADGGSGGAGGGARPGTGRTDADLEGSTATPTAAGRGDGEVIGAAVGREPSPPAGTLPELLRGIEAPCGLIPSVAPDHPDPAQYVVLVTSGHLPQDVGSAVGDELERLGYELHSLSETEVIARRGDDLLSLRLHPEAVQAREGDVALFPTAEPGTVAVELWVGAGPSPRSAP